MSRLKDKVAIVTGAAGGIGKSVSILFAREGAKVLATDMQEEKLATWVKEAEKEGLAISGAVHDVSLAASWEAVVSRAVTLYGKINILVNNAGIYPPGATTESTTVDSFNHVLAVNLTGPFIGTKLCLPYMRSAGGGSVVNISSIAGIVGGNGPAYSASKGALRLLTKDQAVELAKYQIRVNSIHPGGVLTPMTEFLSTSPESQEIMKNLCPMGRMGKDEEIAYGALYLASGESSYTTGTELIIDGGLVAR